jgi:hypothetical protein
MMKYAVNLCIASVGLGLYIAATESIALAQTDSAAARQLFDEARALVTQGNYEEACPRFEQSYRRDPGVGTLFNWADCLEHVGKTASAWAKFRDVADEAARKNQIEREQIATKRAADLLPQLSKIVLRIERVDSGLEIFRDGFSMLLSDQGKSVILDPGIHEFVAKAPGKRSWTSRIDVPLGGRVVEVVVPALEDDASPTETGTKDAEYNKKTVALATVVEAPVEPRRDSTPVSSTQRTFAYVAGGVGVAGVAVGTIFGLRVRSKNNTADSICPSGNNCSPSEARQLDSTISDAKSARNFSYLGFGIGGAALATGVVLYLTAPKPKPTAWRFSPAFDAKQWGATFEGSF